MEYLVNVKNGSLIVTLINNNGYRYSHYLGGERIDESQTIDLTLTYTGNLQVKGVKELWYGDTLPTSASQQITLAPGDAKVIEFYFG